MNAPKPIVPPAQVAPPVKNGLALSHPPPSLAVRQVEKVWGRKQLPAPFDTLSGLRIGEIWFAPQVPCDGLLAKYLFTSEKLSVQVHPDDARAPAGSRGKEECWLVLDAQAGATLAIGFKEKLSPEAMRQAAIDGSIESLLEWHPAKRGDFFYLPAGTVHAIGPGLSLVEIQQNSDITYRLYDYGRPRALHLDAAVAVAECAPYDPKWQTQVDFDQSKPLVDGPHFRLDFVSGHMPSGMKARYQGPLLVLPLMGEVQVSGVTIAPGQCVIAPSLELVKPGKTGRVLFSQSL